MTDFIYFEESWNEDRKGTILDGGISSTFGTEDGTETSR